VAVFEAIMRNLRLSSGVFRTTFPGRFAELDRFVTAKMTARFPREAPIEVHDWAASDCLTSAEWAALLFDAFPNAHLHASDLSLFLIEIERPDGGAFILERGGEALQYVKWPFVVDLNGPAPRRLQTRLEELRSRVRIPPEWLDSRDDAISLPPFTARKLWMIHPKAEAFRRRDQRFSIERHSAFESLAEPAHVIRSMNIYNPGYFEPARLAEGAKAVWRSLHTGGWWIVGRTWREEPPASNVSIFEKDESGFRVVNRFGEGSEIEAPILDGTYAIY
jgi:hypothetical protein